MRLLSNVVKFLVDQYLVFHPKLSEMLSKGRTGGTTSNGRTDRIRTV